MTIDSDHQEKKPHQSKPFKTVLVEVNEADVELLPVLRPEFRDPKQCARTICGIVFEGSEGVKRNDSLFCSTICAWRDNRDSMSSRGIDVRRCC